MAAAPPKSGWMMVSPHNNPVTANGGMTPTLKVLTKNFFSLKNQPRYNTNATFANSMG